MIQLKIRHKQHPHINADKVVADESEKSAWLEAVAQGKFCGLPERWVNENELTEDEKLSALDTRVIEDLGESRTEYKLAAEYVIEEVDIGDSLDWDALRSKRDSLLAQCDWTQLADCPLLQVDKDAWASYRQELRDLPANTVDPKNPVWPVKP